MKITTTYLDRFYYAKHPKVLPLAQKLIDIAEFEGATVKDFKDAMTEARMTVEKQSEQALIKNL